MKSTVTAFALAAALFTAGTNANDLRQVFKYITTYFLSPYNACEAWRCSCVNYIPQDYTLVFQYTLCRPGDLSGNNKQGQVSAYCSYSKDGKTPMSVNKHIARDVNFTFA
ncbi:unnamed protein product [Jaminaea pallidilutea]